MTSTRNTYVVSPEALIERFAASPTPKVWVYLRTGLDTPPAAQHKGVEALLHGADFDSPVFVCDYEEKQHPTPLFSSLFSYLSMVNKTHLVVWRTDCLAKNEAEREVILWLLRNAGITLHTQESLPPSSTLVKEALDSVTMYQQALQHSIPNHGLRRRALRGQWTGGQPPFGYKATDGELVIDGYEAIMVRYIFFLRLYYHMSARQIGTHIEKYKNPNDPNIYNARKISKILLHEKTYRGSYRDCYGLIHPRPDLRILPDSNEELRTLHLKDTNHEHHVNA